MSGRGPRAVEGVGMKFVVATIASVALITSAWAQGNHEEVRRVAPALEKYAQDRLLGDV